MNKKFLAVYLLVLVSMVTVVYLSTASNTDSLLNAGRPDNPCWSVTTSDAGDKICMVYFDNTDRLCHREGRIGFARGHQAGPSILWSRPESVPGINPAYVEPGFKASFQNDGKSVLLSFQYKNDSELHKIEIKNV